MNSALQRARRTVAEKVPPRSQQATLRELDDAALRGTVEGYCDALERGDADALVALLTDDVTWSMPPLPGWYSGRAAVVDFAAAVPLGSCGAWRHVPTDADGQPAVACYLRPGADGPYAAWSVDVLTPHGDRIAAITSFIGAEHVALLELPGSLG